VALADTKGTQTSTARTAKNLKACHLLRLPAELRNKIYEYVIGQYPQPTTLRSLNKKISPRGPGLAFTCRQIRRELLSIFYAESHFLVTDLGPLLRHSKYVFDYLHYINVQFRCAPPKSSPRTKPLRCTLEVWSDACGSLTVASTAIPKLGHRPMCSCELVKAARAAEEKAELESKNALLLFCNDIWFRQVWVLHKPDECPENRF
jgi:hypothetical protein